MKRDIRVLLYGMGGVNIEAARTLLNKKGIEIVGAIEIADEKKIGKDLGQLLDLGRNTGIIVKKEADEVLSETNPDIAIVSIASSVREVYPVMKTLITHKINVITPSEEMAYPYFYAPKLAAELDKLAEENNVSVLGSGASPGFATEMLMLFATATCAEVNSIKREAIVEIPYMQEPRVRKAFGYGVDPGDFQKLVEEGVIKGHRGGLGTVYSIARALGWELDETVHTIEPVVKNGKIQGARTIDIGRIQGKDVIVHDVSLTAGAEEKSKSSIIVNGKPSFTLTFSPYWESRVRTSAVMINQIPHVMCARPGIIYLWELPFTYAILDDFRLFLKKPWLNIKNGLWRFKEWQ